MKIAVLGTGGVGKAFAEKLISLGSHVYLGTRNPAESLQKTGQGSLRDFLLQHPHIQLHSFNEAASYAELLINVCSGAGSPDMINSILPTHLQGKILIDISNPLDFSKGMPPSLLPQYSNTHSLGEELQRLAPGAKVVKTLNTMWNGLMLNPALIAGGDHVNYLCGNDAEAKQQVVKLLHSFGWKNENLLDLGDLSGARATEATLPIWLRIYGVKKTGAFNFRIVS
jgi:predicted dinucleotide-binding enzyme